MFYHVMYDTYSHRIWAKDEKEARDIARKLDFDYREQSFYSPNEYRPSVFASLPGGLGREDVLHSICFLTFLAHRQGIVTTEQVCGDKSPLHALIHHRQFGARSAVFKKQIAKGIIFLEANVLGIPPSSIKLLVYEYNRNYEGVPKDLNEPFDVSVWGNM